MLFNNFAILLDIVWIHRLKIAWLKVIRRSALCEHCSLQRDASIQFNQGESKQKGLFPSRYLRPRCESLRSRCSRENGTGHHPCFPDNSRQLTRLPVSQYCLTLINSHTPSTCNKAKRRNAGQTRRCSLSFASLSLIQSRNLSSRSLFVFFIRSLLVIALSTQ